MRGCAETVLAWVVQLVTTDAGGHTGCEAEEESMHLEDELLQIERALWTGGPEAYGRHLDPDCLVAFSDELAGVSSRDDIARSAAESPRWRDLDLDPRGLIRPSDDVALLTYRARANRGTREQYEALASSCYIRRNGEWKMVFHQQTPLGG